MLSTQNQEVYPPTWKLSPRIALLCFLGADPHGTIQNKAVLAPTPYFENNVAVNIIMYSCTTNNPLTLGGGRTADHWLIWRSTKHLYEKAVAQLASLWQKATCFSSRGNDKRNISKEGTSSTIRYFL